VRGDLHKLQLLGEVSDLERKQTAARLAQLLDAAEVGQVGFTINLYREKGLPRPDTLAKPGQERFGVSVCC
jgi:RNA-binding protein YhbY